MANITGVADIVGTVSIVDHSDMTVPHPTVTGSIRARSSSDAQETNTKRCKLNTDEVCHTTVFHRHSNGVSAQENLQDNTDFDYEVTKANNPALAEQKGLVYLIHNDGSIAVTKSGSLMWQRPLESLPEWQGWCKPCECVHIRLPYQVNEKHEWFRYDKNATFAYVTELDAYRIRNFIRIELDKHKAGTEKFTLLACNKKRFSV
jgi:hypothetical protein